MVVMSLNFSLGEKPQFQGPVTLEINHGEIVYTAQKHN